MSERNGKLCIMDSHDHKGQEYDAGPIRGRKRILRHFCCTGHWNWANARATAIIVRTPRGGRFDVTPFLLVTSDWGHR